jgi:DNA-binding transcriptional LysR family regulator
MQLSDRIGRRMKLHDLHVLMTVVQAGSMSKAATLLNTRQSAISRSIAELEHAVGVRLLERNPRGVEPTEHGRALLDGGAAAFDELRQAVKNIEFLNDPAAGNVRIGCNQHLATTFVSAVIDRLSLRYPRIVFQVAATLAEELHRELICWLREDWARPQTNDCVLNFSLMSRMSSSLGRKIRGLDGAGLRLPT